jgi:hypothetical protein
MLALTRKTVLAAIQFHIEFRLLTKEIKVVNAERVLTTKLVAGEPAVAQPAPDQFFRPRFNLPEPSGAFDVSHDLKLENSTEPAKLVLMLALTLTLSPGEREWAMDAFVFSADYPAIPDLSFAQLIAYSCKTQGAFHLLPGGEGRDEGGRDTIIINLRY